MSLALGKGGLLPAIIVGLALAVPGRTLTAQARNSTLRFQAYDPILVPTHRVRDTAPGESTSLPRTQWATGAAVGGAVLGFMALAVSTDLRESSSPGSFSSSAGSVLVGALVGVVIGGLIGSSIPKGS